MDSVRVLYEYDYSERTGYVTGDQSCESGSMRRRLPGWAIGAVAQEAGHVAGDVFDIEFMYIPTDSEDKPKSTTRRGVLCSDGSFELIGGPHRDAFASSEYLSTTLGAILSELGYRENGYTEVPIKVSTTTVRKMETSGVLGRTRAPRLFKLGD
ncbi:MAG: hypothetical protein ABIH90_01215 [Candidatus Aenigmatarchaeota archaeon]